MKRNRLLSGALALTLVLSLTTVPAFAATFPDVPTGYWAESYINDMAEQGVFKGYDNGEFRPKNELQGSEALALCARIAVETDLRAQIGKDRADDISAIMGDQQSWFRDEYATCLEAGILSYTELKGLYDSGALDNGKTITKEDFALYLVRAMQLDSMAENLTSYSLNYADTSSIAEVLKPYVYLLSTYGIVQGNSANQFMPKGSLTRAEMATMLRRAIDFTDAQGIYAELPAYTSYAWTGGTITSVSTASDGTTAMVLSSNISGVTSLTLPASAPIYENNMRTTPTALRQGQYVRVNLDSAGNPQSARLGGGLTALTGTVSTIDQGSISVQVNGANRLLTIDRFTKVQVDQQVGGQALIDPSTDYTRAQCWVDGMGHLAELKLTGGGPTSSQGVLQSVTYGSPTTLLVQNNQGQSVSYSLDLLALPTIRRDGKLTTIDQLRTGDRITVTVQNGKVTDISASTQAASQVTGTLVVTDLASGTMALRLTDGNVIAADVSSANVITSAGTAATLSSLTPGDRLQLYGQYSGNQFVATLIIRL